MIDKYQIPITVFITIVISSFLMTFAGYGIVSIATNKTYSPNSEVCRSYDQSTGECASTITINELIEEAKNATNN